MSSSTPCAREYNQDNALLISERETWAEGTITAIPMGKQAVPIFNVLLEGIIYAGFHWAAVLVCHCLGSILIWDSAVGPGMLSYLTILASWPVLTQNNVRRKWQHSFRELDLTSHLYSQESFPLDLQAYFALCNGTLGCAWFYCYHLRRRAFTLRRCAHVL